jgi:hypothetical protein
VGKPLIGHGPVHMRADEPRQLVHHVEELGVLAISGALQSTDGIAGGAIVQLLLALRQPTRSLPAAVVDAHYYTSTHVDVGWHVLYINGIIVVERPCASSVSFNSSSLV